MHFQLCSGCLWHSKSIDAKIEDLYCSTIHHGDTAAVSTLSWAPWRQVAARRQQHVPPRDSPDQGESESVIGHTHSRLSTHRAAWCTGANACNAAQFYVESIILLSTHCPLLKRTLPVQLFISNHYLLLLFCDGASVCKHKY